jgi:hypothetical protein
VPRTESTAAQRMWLSRNRNLATGHVRRCRGQARNAVKPMRFLALKLTLMAVRYAEWRSEWISNLRYGLSLSAASTLVARVASPSP